MPRRAASAAVPTAIPAVTRPFYLIGHNTNDLDQIEQGLQEGLNAFELDINKDHTGQLYVAHDPVNPVQTGRYYKAPLTTEAFFTKLKALFQTDKGKKIALIILDCKISDPDLGVKLLNETRTFLTDNGTTVPVIFSSAFLKDADPLFSRMHASLTEKEGLMVDQEADASNVADYFERLKFPRACYGDGLTTIVGVGLPTPNLVSEFDLAASIKAAGRLTFIYPWVLVMAETMREFIRVGVDGILVDVGLSAPTLSDVVKEKEIAAIVHRAVRDDDPFAKPPPPVVLEVVTGDERTSGTDSLVTLTIHRKDGSTAKRQVDGDWGGRFERGMSTCVSLFGVDLQLDDVDGITVKQDGSGWASDWYLERINLRQGDQPPRSCVFRKWIVKGKPLRRPCT